MRFASSSLIFVAIASLVTAQCANAQDGPNDEVPPLVVAIAVDQLSADLFSQYRGHFTGGLAQLQQGAVFSSGYQSHAATETCPGHSTILTGTRPARNGIVANWWFDPDAKRKNKQVYCAEDVSDPDSAPHDPVISAAHLKVPTLGTWIKRGTPQSRNVAISGKDRAAVMMGGHDIDAGYWWKGKGFATFKGKELSAAAMAVNGDHASRIAAGAPGLPVPQWCEARSRAVSVGDFTIGDYRFAVPPGQGSAYGRSPHQDGAVADLAIRLIDEQRLGRDDAPDVLSISFSATDYIGHAFGHQGVEMCIQLAQLDATIGRVFAALDERGIDYVAVLTADHGGIDAPERLSEQGYPLAQRLSGDLSVKALSAEVSRVTGIAEPEGGLLLGSVWLGDMFVSGQLTDEQRQRAALAAVDLLKAHPQVADVFTSWELTAVPMPGGSPQDWTLKDRARASFDADISGDIMVMLARGVVPMEARQGIVSTHGSPWDYDRRVPILVWRKGMAGLEQPAPVETVDIAPTLAAILGLELPEGTFDGRCLDIDGGISDICAE